MRTSSLVLGVFLSCVLILAAAPGAARAQFFERVTGSYAMPFDRLAPDVRSRALGGAVVAAPDGAADVWWNPAALPSGHSVEVQYAPIDVPSLLPGIELRTWAVAAQWSRLRLGVARTEQVADPLLARTAFDPEGHYVDTGSRAWTFNASADLAPWLVPAQPDFNLGFGVSARRLSSFVEVMEAGAERSETEAWDLDLGLLAARRWRGPGSWLRLRAAAMLRNACGAEVDGDGRGADLPRDLRLGLACEAGLQAPAGGRSPLQALLAYTRFQDLDGWRDDDSDHLGLEVTLYELLALRGGTSNESYLGDPAYGVGLLLARQGVWPCGLRVDYVREEWETLGGGWREQWAVTAWGELF